MVLYLFPCGMMLGVVVVVIVVVVGGVVSGQGVVISCHVPQGIQVLFQKQCSECV